MFLLTDDLLFCNKALERQCDLKLYRQYNDSYSVTSPKLRSKK